MRPRSLLLLLFETFALVLLARGEADVRASLLASPSAPFARCQRMQILEDEEDHGDKEETRRVRKAADDNFCWFTEGSISPELWNIPLVLLRLSETHT